MNTAVENVFNGYPQPVREKMLCLRQFVFDTAKEHKEIGCVTETLKWREPAYLAQHGSTIRLSWKPQYPEQYAICFHCQTKLIDTFKVCYKGIFRFEGNRAIIFALDAQIPAADLKHCILLALRYHKLKHLPFLGV